IVPRFQREWRWGDWVRASPARAHPMALSVWISSQALAGVFRAPEATDADLRGFLPALDAPFDPSLTIEAGGVPWGWRPSRSDYTEAEPALWTAAALAEALGR